MFPCEWLDPASRKDFEQGVGLLVTYSPIHPSYPTHPMQTHTLPTAPIMASHVAGLAVMKCEASVTPQGCYRVELWSLF